MSEPDFSNTQWVTAQELLASRGVGIEPGQPLTVDMDHSDVLQNQLGNCWLLAALSAVAEYTRDKDHNADISNLFLTKEYYPGQPVEIQLFHVDLRNPEASTLQPMVFAVPDMFLAKDGLGFTIKVQGPDDVWVLFLEAAFAMMAAGKDTIDYDCYAALNGGFPHHGIMGLTGTKNVDEFTVDRSSGTISVRNLATGQHATVSNDQVWQMLLAAEQAAELLVCTIDDADGDGDREGYRGLVEGHAYSIKEVYTRDDGVQLVRVRNPWGNNNTGQEAQLAQVALECHGDGMCDFDLDTFLQYHHSIWVVNRHRAGSCLDFLQADGQPAYHATQQVHTQDFKDGAAGVPWGENEDDVRQEADQGGEGEVYVEGVEVGYEEQAAAGYEADGEAWGEEGCEEGGEVYYEEGQEGQVYEQQEGEGEYEQQEGEGYEQQQEGVEVY